MKITAEFAKYFLPEVNDEVAVYAAVMALGRVAKLVASGLVDDTAKDGEGMGVGGGVAGGEVIK